MINLIVSKGRSNNLALGLLSRASSEETGKGNVASNGNDGDLNTRWCANDGNVPHWWRVNLGALCDLTGTEVVWEFDGRAIGYVIETSTDGRNWEVVMDKQNNTNGAQIQRDKFSAFGVRLVRITITKLPANTWAGFWEFSVFGSPSTSVQEQTNLPKETRLEQNYPNPFNAGTTIRYALAKPGQVQLKLFNIQGQEVRRMVDEQQAAGEYSVQLNCQNLASGIYFYELKSDAFEQRRKFLLIK